MRILVLGATGRVGHHIVEDGVARGHDITALARDPASLGIHVRTLRGDVLDAAALDRAVVGQDAVIYAVGIRSNAPTTVFSTSTRLLVTAMSRQHVKRLVAITGVGAGETRGHGGFLYDHVIYPLFTRNRYRDKELQEVIIRESGLDWTIVRPAPFREGAAASPFQVVTDVGRTVLRRVSPSEVAGFVLDELDSNRFVRCVPFIGHAH